MRAPKVSVIVPVYNRAASIAAAVNSLTSQTFDDMEIIVVDDGSTDTSGEVVESLSDQRIRLLRHGRNRGIPAARNTGLMAATGQYVAWLDSDDLARPQRIAVQARFLDTNPAIAMVGTCASAHQGLKIRQRVPCFSPESIAPTLLFRSAFQQSSIMGRSDVLQAYPYREQFPLAEDIDQFIRLSRSHRLANIPRVLVDRAIHEGQITGQHTEAQRGYKATLFRDSLDRLNVAADDSDLQRHITLGRVMRIPLSREFLDWSENWLLRLLDSNRRARVYDQDGMKFALARLWERACRGAQRGDEPAHAWRRLTLSSLSRGLFNRQGRGWMAGALSASLSARTSGRNDR